MTPRRKRPNGAGQVRQLRSGRWQARHTGPDGVTRTAPSTFDTRLDATAWCDRQNRDVAAGLWTPPEAGADSRQTVREYADRWLATRTLKPRTRSDYRRILDRLVLPDLGDVPLDRLTPSTVRSWYAQVAPDSPAMRAAAYSLLATIYRTAVLDGLVPVSPCRVEGGGRVDRSVDPVPATLPELAAITEAMPARYRAMVLLAAWCGLRFGELTELRRGDVDLDARVVRVRRGVTRADGAYIVGTPKTAAGRRNVTLPPHLVDPLRDHLDQHTGPAGDALLFPARGGGHMAPSSLYKVFYPARAAAGRPDLRWHDLRHTGATLAAATGATLADLMARLGHSTPRAAMIYQHSAEDRQAAIADALSGFAVDNVVPLRRRAQ